jgi:hypothetical protein
VLSIPNWLSSQAPCSHFEANVLKVEYIYFNLSSKIMNEALIKDSTIVQGKFTEELSPDMGTGLVLRLKTDCSVVWLKDKMHCFRV